MSRRFVKFLLVSGVAAVTNIGSRIFFSLWLPYVTAILLAFCVGLGSAFVLNRLFVFREPTNPLHHQAFWFMLVNLAAVAKTLAVSLFLVRSLFPTVGFHWHVDTVAHTVGVGIPAVTSYFGHKYLSFRGA